MELLGRKVVLQSTGSKPSRDDAIVHGGKHEIHNEGPGIPMELLPQVFERFVAGADSRGLGLGLYLAKQIALAHEGDLSVDSPPGQGTRFWLRLPALMETMQQGTAI